MAVAAVPAPAPPAASARRHWPAGAATALVTTAYLGLAFLLFAPAWAHPTSTLIGDQIDSGPMAWFLNWTPFAIGHGANPLTSGWIGYPHGANLAWSTAMPLLGVLFWPVTATAGAVVAFNLAVTAGLALTALATYFALRRWVASPFAAAVGGLLAGFSPYMLAHAAAGHVDLVTTATVPVLLILFDELLVRRRRPPLVLGAAIGAVAAAQVYVAEEVLATEVVAAVVGLGVLAAVAGSRLRMLMARDSIRRVAVAAASAAPVALLLAVPLLWTQFFGPQHITGAVQPGGRYVTDLANLVVPTRLQAVAPSAATRLSDGFTGNLGEWTGYLGVPLLVTALAVAWWQRRQLLVRWAFGVAVVMGLLSFGARLHVAGRETALSLPWRAVAHLPLLDNVLPGRMSIYVVVALAVMVACGVDVLLRGRNRTLQAAGAALLALVAVSLAPALPSPTRTLAVPAFFTVTAQRVVPPGSVAYVLPSVDQDAMLWQLESGMRFRLLGGWFLGPDAQGHVQTGPRATPLTRAVADVETSGDIIGISPSDVARYRAELRADSVQTIVVTRFEPNAQAVVRFLQILTGTPPRSDGAGTSYFADLR